MPAPLWGMGYTAANDELIVSGGIGNGTLTNAGYAYDPATDTWSDLPAANSVTYRGGSACGLDRIGGSTSSGFHPSGVAETLPGYWACGESDTPWLTLDRDAVTLAPGERIVVTAELAADTGQPGVYAADVWIKEKTPYAVKPIDITMRVAPHGHD
jgi:Kelch motif